MTNAVDQIVAQCCGDISVFLGTGASVPVGLPDMRSFWKNAYGDDFLKSLNGKCNYRVQAKKDLTQGDVNTNSTSALRRLIQTASLERETVSLDLEVIYDYIHNNPMLADGRKNIESVKKLFYFYSVSQRYSGNSSNPAFVDYHEQYANFYGDFTTWIDDVYECIAKLRHEVDKAYLIKRDTHSDCVEKAKGIYAFLPKLFARQCPTIFTTNYDTIFEALDDAGNLKEFGYSLQSGSRPEGNGRHFYFSIKNYLERVKSPLFLFHLHGSVAWERQSGGKTEDHYPKLHESKSAIIEPVISKKLPKNEPFKGMCAVFEKTLLQNKVLLVIGFSFRDEAIKSLVEKRLNATDDFHVVCVAPQNKNEPDVDSHLDDLEAKYPSKFIWLKNYFGVPETESLMLETIGDILQRSPTT